MSGSGADQQHGEQPPLAEGEPSRKQGPEGQVPQQASPHEHDHEPEVTATAAAAAVSAYPYQQRASYVQGEDESPSSSPVNVNLNVNAPGYAGLPPFVPQGSYHPAGQGQHQQQGGPGGGQYAQMPSFPPQGGASAASAGALMGYPPQQQQQHPGHDQRNVFPGGMYGGGFPGGPQGGAPGSNDPSPVPPYRGALPPHSRSQQGGGGGYHSQPEQHMYGPGPPGGQGRYVGAGGGYSSDGARGGYGSGEQQQQARGPRILPPPNTNMRGAGGRGGGGDRRDHSHQQRGGPGPGPGSQSPHHQPLGSPYFGGGGTTEGVSAALSMTGGPGYLGPPHGGAQQGGEQGGQGANVPPLPMFHQGGWAGYGGAHEQQQQMNFPPGGPPGGFGGVPPGGFGGPMGGMPEYAGFTEDPTGAPIFNPGAPIQTSNTRTGPEGANLFIFHIPNEMTNQGMYELFSRCGNPLSVRIMVEKHNGRSKGYGFVSYDNRESAAQAIIQLNGHSVHGKRLKVQHKQNIDHRGGDHHNQGGGGRGGGYRGGGRGGGGGGGHRSRASPVEQEPFGMGMMPPPPGGGGMLPMPMPPGGMMVPGPPQPSVAFGSDVNAGPYQSAEGVLQDMLPPRVVDTGAASGAPHTSPRRPDNQGRRKSSNRDPDMTQDRDSPDADIATNVLPPFPKHQDDPQSQNEDDDGVPSTSADQDTAVFDLSQLGADLPGADSS